MFPPRIRPTPATPLSQTRHRARARHAAVALVAVLVASTSAQGPASGTVPALRFAFPLATPWVPAGGQPIVVDLDRDGQPEIISMSEAGFASRRLTAVRGATTSVAFSIDAFVTTGAPPVVLGDSFSELAAGDLDGDGFPEVIGVDAYVGVAGDPSRQSILALRPNGTPLWLSDDVVSDPLIDSTSGFLRPVIADVDGDGSPEIVVGYAGRGPLTPQNIASEDYVTVFDNLGHIRWTARGGGTTQGGNPTSNAPVVVDLDLDGTPEILFSDDVFNANGTLRRSVNSVQLRPVDVSVANFDDDPYPEILYLDGTGGRLWLYQHDGVPIWGPIVPPGPQNGLGLPAIGDVTGDGLPEIVVVRHQSIEVLTGAGTSLFSVPLAHVTGGGNVTIFDLNADGRAEIIFHSMLGAFDTPSQRGALVVVDGQTRTVHSIFAPRNGSDDQRGPIVADVTGDGTAEIVVRGYNEHNLFRVYSANSGTWAETRPIWNQYGYHVTHVRPTGVIPAHAPINWLTAGLNSFRVNGGPDQPSALPPVSVADAYSTAAGSAITVAAPGVLGNDTANGQPIKAALVGPPAHGTVTLSASGSFQYTPAAGYAGGDSWTYRAVSGPGPGQVVAVTMTVTAANVPVPPTNLRLVSLAGNTVTLAWTPPTSGPTPTGYQLEGGLSPGAVLGALPVSSPGLTVGLPTGVLYLRVRTLAAGTASAASNEIAVAVNVPTPPGAPTNLLGLVVGNGLTLTWRNATGGGTPTAILLDVSGPITGSLPLGPSEGFSFPSVPAGTYTFSVRAANATGTSAASNPVTLTFPTACSGAPLPPTGFSAGVSGSVISLAWNTAASGAAPTGYVLNVSGAFTGSLPLTVRALSAPVPPGSYTLSVAATNPCGSSAPTTSTTVTVP